MLRKLSGSLIILISMFVNTHAEAQESCADIFLESPRQTISLPSELRLTPEKIEYGLNHGYAELLQITHGSVQLFAKINTVYFPTFLKRSSDLLPSQLEQVPVVETFWQQDTSKDSYRRAYTVVHELLSLAAEHTDVQLTHQPTEKEKQFLAFLLEPQIADPAPEIFVEEILKSTMKLRHKVKLLLKNREYQQLWLKLIDGGIEFSMGTSPVGWMLNGQVFKLEKVAGVQNKLRSHRQLNDEDVGVLAILAQRFLISHVMNVSSEGIDLHRHVESILSAPLSMNRRELISLLADSLVNLLVNANDHMMAKDMFDYLYFGVALPRAQTQIWLALLEKLNPFYVPLKNAYTTEARQNQTLSSFQPTRSTLFQFRPTDTVLPTLSEIPSGEKIKTRGRARPPENAMGAHVESGEYRIQINDLLNKSHIFVAQSDTDYIVTFAHKVGGYHGEQIIRFDENTADWLIKNPKIAIEFYRSIMAGPTTNSNGQSGIKLISHRSHSREGRLYEVKIRSSYRLVFERVNNVWTALGITPKDRFDSFIRTL